MYISLKRNSTRLREQLEEIWPQLGAYESLDVWGIHSLSGLDSYIHNYISSMGAEWVLNNFNYLEHLRPNPDLWLG